MMIVIHLSIALAALIVCALGILFLFKKEIVAVLRARRVPRGTFVCSRCGECCGFTVTLTRDDVERLRKAGHDIDDCVIGKIGLRTLRREKGVCVFLEFDEDGVARCSIHEDRPDLCRRFPFATYLGRDAVDDRCPVIKERLEASDSKKNSLIDEKDSKNDQS